MTLPEPDSHGNYWLGKLANPPAILSSPLIPETKERRPTTKYYLSLDTEDVFLFNKGSLVYFDSPQEALDVYLKMPKAPQKNQPISKKAG